MANKCTTCGKFVSADGAKCSSCGVTYHRQCANIKADVRLTNKWVCKGCKTKPMKNTSSQSDSSASPESKYGDAAYAQSNSSDLNLGREFKHIRTQLSTIMQEMTSWRQEMSSFRQEVVKLNSTVAEFNNRLNSVEDKVNNVTKRLAEAETKIGSGSEFDVAAEIERRLNDRDQEIYSSDLEITGVQELASENPNHLVSLVAQKLRVDVDERDVVFAACRGKRRSADATEDSLRPRTLLVRLARHSLRDQLISAARSRRGIDSSGIVANSPPRRLYINERLTWFNRRIFHRARQEARSRDWRYVWTRDGRIYARRDADSPAMRIRMEVDVEKIFCSKIN